jgi:hypothetical protein
MINNIVDHIAYLTLTVAMIVYNLNISSANITNFTGIQYNDNRKQKS